MHVSRSFIAVCRHQQWYVIPFSCQCFFVFFGAESAFVCGRRKGPTASLTLSCDVPFLPVDATLVIGTITSARTTSCYVTKCISLTWVVAPALPTLICCHGLQCCAPPHSIVSPDPSSLAYGVAVPVTTPSQFSQQLLLHSSPREVWPVPPPLFQNGTGLHYRVSYILSIHVVPLISDWLIINN